MNSILTNRSALAALATLQSISNDLDETTSRVSTGLKISKAADNPNYWVVANNLRADSKMLGSISDSIGMGVATLDTAYNGVDQIIKVLTDIKNDLATARTPAADKVKINTDLDTLKQRLSSITKASSFNGDNWLYNSSSGAAGTKNITASFSRDASGNISLNTIQINIADLTLIDTNTANRGLLTKAVDVIQSQDASTTATTTASYFLIGAMSTTSAASATAGVTASELKLTSTTSDVEIDGMIKAVDNILSSVMTIGTTFGSHSNGAQNQKEFVKSLLEANQKGMSSLIDADMNAELTKLKALQTQEQLSLQALSIANSQAEKLLILFRQ